MVAPVSARELAQVNIGRLRAPVGDPLVAEFVAALDEVNALADAAPGFVWRLQTDSGNATDVHAFADPLVIINLSVWSSLDALKAFVYRTAHVEFLRRRSEWFEPMATASMALWWMPAGHRPDANEAVARLDRLDRDGPSDELFTFRSQPHAGRRHRET